jgi:hypothetical protein
VGLVVICFSCSVNQLAPICVSSSLVRFELIPQCCAAEERQIILIWFSNLIPMFDNFLIAM